MGWHVCWQVIRSLVLILLIDQVMMLSHKYNQFNCDLLKIVRRNPNSALYIVSGILLLNIAVCITVAAIYKSEKSVPSGINYGLFPEYYNKYSVKLSCYMYICISLNWYTMYV